MALAHTHTSSGQKLQNHKLLSSEKEKQALRGFNIPNEQRGLSISSESLIAKKKKQEITKHCEPTYLLSCLSTALSWSIFIERERPNEKTP